MPVKMPLVYHYGCASADENTRLFKALVTRLGLSVKSRADADEGVRASGVIIDTPGGIAAASKGGSYEMIQHVISEFNVNVLLVLGSERLFNDLKKKVNDTATTVIRLDKSGGCVDRDESYMQQLRQTQIREYFFGYGAINLAPHSMLADFAHLSVYKIVSTTPTATSTAPSFNVGGADDEDDDFYEPSATIAAPAVSSNASSSILEKATPSNLMTNSLLAVTFAQPNASIEQIRDAAVMGYVYVAEVDEVKRKVKLLSPVGGAAPRNAMLWGEWPESVVNLVN
jgi:polyribonucleotide 5'-hydroxyl-kinase